MKKIFTYCILLVMSVTSVFTLTGCDDKSDTIIVAEVTHSGVIVKTKIKTHICEFNIISS